MKKWTGLICLIVPVFLLYFISESFLRAAAVANINPEKVKLDNLLNDLPESVRDAVTYRIMHTDLTNALAAAKSEDERVSILSQLGDYTRDQAEKERIFELLRGRYPARPESAPAFVYYLLRTDSPKQITVPEFHRYLLKFGQLERFNIWAMALNRLTQLKTSDRDKLAFMLPLLDMKPEYRDYSIFYTEIVQLAGKLMQTQTANRADRLIDDCRLCPSIEEVQLEREEQKMAAEAARKKSGKKRK
ncbi:MAG: hypothetical protein IJS14_00025 [Lentisphaeria bacterium]|nr:hypothetical protein [Lentisphaeria bacterium]